MAKIDLNTVSSGYLSQAALNANFTAIENEFQNKVLYRDNPSGEPNSMQSNLDMNGYYVLNAGNTSLADADNIAYTFDNSAAEARTISDKLNEIVSVKDFGAVGDGVTDDTAAIQAATTSAAATGNVVWFPAGIYRLLSAISLPSNTDWRGTSGSKIYLDPAMTLGAVIAGVARAIYTQNTQNLSFDSLEFYSLKTGLTKSISVCFENPSNVQINNCVFRDFGNATYYAPGFLVFGGDELRFTNSKFQNCSGDGAALSNSCTNFFIEGNEFSSNSDWGLAITIGCNKGIVSGNLFLNNTSTATGSDRCTNLVFSSNVMLNNEHGVRVCEFADTVETNQTIAITNNTIYNSAVAGVSIEKAQPLGLVTVIGNVISGSSNQGIRVVDAANISIVGNTIYSCTAAAILFEALTVGQETGRATVVGNKTSTSTYGLQQITAAGNSSAITVVGNDFTQCSVAPITTVNANYIDGDSSANYFNLSKTLNVPSGIYSDTATAGGVAPPANVWGFLPIYFGGTLKKIPVYNA